MVLVPEARGSHYHASPILLHNHSRHCVIQSTTAVHFSHSTCNIIHSLLHSCVHSLTNILERLVEHSQPLDAALRHAVGPVRHLRSRVP
jgi:hypothetical protein